MKNTLKYLALQSVMMLILISLNSNAFCQADTLVPNYKIYELKKIDTNFQEIYIYLQFERQHKKYDVLLVKDSVKVTENLKMCPVKLKGKYKLSLVGLNYIPHGVLKDGVYYWPIFQHPHGNGKIKIGGTYSNVYTTDQLMGTEIDCNLISKE